MDAYLDAQQDFPNTAIPLETEDGTYYHFKTDVFKRLMWYSPSRDNGAGAKVAMLSVDSVNEIISQNKGGKKVRDIAEVVQVLAPLKDVGYENVIAQDSITRFDEKANKGNRKRKKNRRPNRPTNSNSAGNAND